MMMRYMVLTLLANKITVPVTVTMVDIQVEESTKKKDEDYDFFKEKEKTPEIPTFKEEEKKSIPIDDPLLNENGAYENGGFKPLGAMNVQEIK